MSTELTNGSERPIIEPDAGDMAVVEVGPWCWTKRKGGA